MQSSANQDAARARSAATLVDYGDATWTTKYKMDYFAVSLPDFLVFEDDLSRRNRIHCLYMAALGHLGLEEYEQAASAV